MQYIRLLLFSENLTRRLRLRMKNEIKDDIIGMSISNRELELMDLKRYIYSTGITVGLANV